MPTLYKHDSFLTMLPILENSKERHDQRTPSRVKYLFLNGDVIFLKIPLVEFHDTNLGRILKSH